MVDQGKEQIDQWLKKLERESWQLELLVSAFTIFLLIQAEGAYSGMLEAAQYEYNLGDSLLSFLFIFFALLRVAIWALITFLVIHLLLRGFWIGTIGLRSVQSEIHFDKFNYSEYFTKRLEKKVISLDNMVVRLDEICSLVFSFAFLVMSILISFGLYMLFLGLLGVSLGLITNSITGVISTIVSVIGGVVVLTTLITGIIYLIDYFTLGFFKKFSWFSKIYYPFYRFYGVITLSVISKSIYYYLISKFSKKRIRIVYLLAFALLIFNTLVSYDQYQYFARNSDSLHVVAHQYDDLRPENEYIEGVSIGSKVVSGSFLQLFLRYDPADNDLVASNCPEFVPEKKEGFNWSMQFIPNKNGGVSLISQDFDGENKEELLQCLASLYRVNVNDSTYSDLNFFWYIHPSKEQKGLITMLNTENFKKGENLLTIKKISMDEEGVEEIEDFAYVPFWLE